MRSHSSDGTTTSCIVTSVMSLARFFPCAKPCGCARSFVTTFYGYDVSSVIREHGPGYYDGLRRACSLYFVMSEDMRRRVVEQGFPVDQVRVHPVSIDVEDYPFRIRELGVEEPLHLVSVGRFVEKKGFDDLLRAMAAVRDRAPGRASCSIVGGGPLDAELRELARALGLADVVDFRGYLAIEDVIRLFDDAHVLVQPSKTASDGTWSSG